MTSDEDTVIQLIIWITCLAIYDVMPVLKKRIWLLQRVVSSLKLKNWMILTFLLKRCDIVLCVQCHFEIRGFNYKLVYADRVMWYTLDNMMKICSEEGLGNKVWQADIISFADEDRMWLMGVLGTERPEQLVKTLLLGITCALKGREGT